MNNFERTVKYGTYFEGQGTTPAAKAAGGSRATNNVHANPSGVKETTDLSGTADAVKGNSLVWWLVIAGLFAMLTFFVEKFDSGSTFGNVKLSFYNVIVIGLNAVLFIVLVKAFALKVKIPGLSAILLAT